MSKIVIALGGNALGKNPQEQHDRIESTVKYLIDLVQAGNQIVITHGNGPQVGMIYDSMKEDKVPFAESGAMSQGYIGYQLQQSLKDELNKRKIKNESERTFKKKCVRICLVWCTIGDSPAL